MYCNYSMQSSIFFYFNVLLVKISIKWCFTVPEDCFYAAFHLCLDFLQSNFHRNLK